MPSLFPELYTYALIAPFVLRIVLAIAVIRYGTKSFGGGSNPLSKIFGGIMLASGVLVAIGLFTQAAALGIITALVLIKIFKSKMEMEKVFSISKTIIIFMTGIAASLLLLGPGIFSFDLPL